MYECIELWKGNKHGDEGVKCSGNREREECVDEQDEKKDERVG